MKRPPHPFPPGRARARRAFTLVELITATALMTVMMLGVVQIFAIVTQTAGDAQAMEFAIQQQRALFDTLYNDFNGLTREGYLRIAKGYFDVTTAVGTNAPMTAFPNIIPTLTTYKSGTMKPANTIPPPLPITLAGPAAGNCESWYGCDTLQFVSIGQFRSVAPNLPWNNPSGGANATASGAAEIMYTNNVLTPTNFLKVEPVGEPAVLVDNRKGVLMRAAWLIGTSGAAGASTDDSDQALAPWLSELQTTAQTRTNITVFTTAGVRQLRVTPFVLGAPTGAVQIRLNRVMSCCTSEFFVEWFDPGTPTTPIDNWFGAVSWTGVGSSITLASTDTNKTYGKIDPCTAGAGQKLTWPRAVRVTMAIHDPADRTPLQSNVNRYRGYAMQGVFWIKDP